MRLTGNLLGSAGLDRIRAVDKARLVTKLGAANKKTLDAALKTMQEVFAD